MTLRAEDELVEIILMSRMMFDCDLSPIERATSILLALSCVQESYDAVVELSGTVSKRRHRESTRTPQWQAGRQARGESIRIELVERRKPRILTAYAPYTVP